ncbi:MAG: lysylphosphatidylglycerol synthase transmembrane domain-containing protein [Bryobacteraceae bacterium]
MTRKHVGAGFAVAATLGMAGFVVYRWRRSGFVWHEFSAALENVDWTWLALALALILATYVGRALRWEVMLRPLKKNTTLWPVFSATAIGFTAVVLFGRAGEPVRPYLIAKKEGVSFSSQVAAWVVERILDLLMVLVIFGMALSQVSRSAIQHGPRVKLVLEAGGYTAGVTGAACLALLLGLRQFRGGVQKRLMEGLTFLPVAVTDRIAKALQSFGEGMESMRSGARTALLVFYTIVEWCVIAAAFGCVFKAFPATHELGVTDVVILLGFVCFGSIVQIPGVGGGMQIVTVLMLTEFFGVRLEAASGIALVLWIITFVAIVPLGLVLAFHEGINWRNLRHIEPTAMGGAGT